MNPEKFSMWTGTSEKAEEIQISLLKQLSTAERAFKTFLLSHEMITLSKRAIQRQNPELNEFELKLLYLEHFYGREIARNV